MVLSLVSVEGSDQIKGRRGGTFAGSLDVGEAVGSVLGASESVGLRLRSGRGLRACVEQGKPSTKEMITMSQQSDRIRARRAALDVQTRVRKRREEQDRRRSALGVIVVTALAERDATIAACEARAGEALHTMTREEGLSLREAIEWCGGSELLSAREGARLRRLATAPGRIPTAEVSAAAAPSP